MNNKGQIPHNRGLRHDAKLRGDVQYFTGKECKNGHIEKRLVSNGVCMECARLQTDQLRKKETIEQKELRLKSSAHRAAEWRKNNPNHENTKIVKQRWNEENREVKNAKSREYYKLYPKKRAEAGRNWRKNNPEKNVAKTAKRNAAKLQRTPVWLNAGHWLEIASIYELCSAWRGIGFDYHVDHIIPLQGKSVSGMHVPWNLQILNAKENISKGNRV